MIKDMGNNRRRGRSGTVIRTSSGVSRLHRPSEIPLVVTMRVKDEERILPRCLESLRDLECPVIVLDDGSKDRTPEIARSYEYVHYHRQDAEINELRDRAFLFRIGSEYRPEWIFTIDGDEVLPARTVTEILRTLDGMPDEVNILKLAIAWIWRENWFVRFESGPFYHHRFYRASNSDPGMPYTGTKIVGAPDFKHGLHCGPLPTMLSPVVPANIRAYIKAYGYDTPEAVKQHIEFYHRYDETFWSQREIIERMSEPLDPWDDKLLPEEPSPMMTRALIDRKIDMSLSTWERETNVKREDKTDGAPIHTTRRPGRPRKTERAPGASHHAGGVGG